MPYIADKKDRKVFDKIVDIFGDFFAKKGNLNYFLCRLFKNNAINYENARNFLGDLECAKLEIYRRFISPYEDLKREENGDV